MTDNEERRPLPGTAPDPVTPSQYVTAPQVAAWLEAVEAAIENPDIATDLLCDLAERLEAAWLAATERAA